MASEKLEAGECFPILPDLKTGYVKNALYSALSKAMEPGYSFPVVGVCHTGIEMPVAGIRGVSNHQKSLGVEIAFAEESILKEDGSLTGTDYFCLEDGCSEALTTAYFLDSALCWVRKHFGEEVLCTRSPILIGAMVHSSDFSVFTERYLKDNIDEQIRSGKLRAFQIDPADGECSLDIVSPARNTIAPQFLLRRATEKLIRGLYEKSARIAYPDEFGKVHYDAVSLQKKYIHSKLNESAGAYRRAAWNGINPDIVLPVYRAAAPKQRVMRLFSMFQIRDIEWFSF